MSSWAEAQLRWEWEPLEAPDDVVVARGVAGRDAIAVVRAAVRDGRAALLVTRRAWEMLEPDARSSVGEIAPPAAEEIASIGEELRALERQLGRPLGDVVSAVDLGALDEVIAGELSPEELFVDDEEADDDDAADAVEHVGGPMLVLVPERIAHDVDGAWALLTPSRPVDVVVGPGTPASLLGALGFGGFNDCPNPPEQVARWSALAADWGALPVVVDGDRLEAIAMRPPRALDDVARLTATLLAYDRDLAQELVPLSIACRLWGATVWRFWWD